MSRVMLYVVGLVVFTLGQVSSAAMLQIQLGGVDIRYNGNAVIDASPSGLDPLTNATFLVDDVAVGVRTTGVGLGMFVPGVLNIPAAGGQVDSAPGGSLFLSFGDADFLSLSLSSAVVTYVPISGAMRFVFLGSAAAIEGQQLPFGLTLGEPVYMSFSTQVTSLTTSGGFVQSFSAAGTGEVQGVPEPATLTVLVLGGLAVLHRRRCLR